MHRFPTAIDVTVCHHLSEYPQLRSLIGSIQRQVRALPVSPDSEAARKGTVCRNLLSNLRARFLTISLEQCTLPTSHLAEMEGMERPAHELSGDLEQCDGQLTAGTGLSVP